jgi:hypothetical protein
MNSKNRPIKTRPSRNMAGNQIARFIYGFLLGTLKICFSLPGDWEGFSKKGAPSAPWTGSPIRQ